MGDNGKKPRLPDDKDYIVLKHIKLEGLQITLDMYLQKDWQLMAVLNAPNGEFIMIFRRRMVREY